MCALVRRREIVERISPMKIRRRVALDLLLVLLLLFATHAIASAAEFNAVGAARELKGAPGVYEWTFEATVGKSPFDKVALHRDLVERRFADRRIPPRSCSTCPAPT